MSVYNLITRINELKTLTKYISCKCKCKFDYRKCNSYQKWNNDKCWCEYENPEDHNECEKYHIWNPATCSCENFEHLTRTIDDSVITFDEIINAAGSVLKNGSANVMRTV